MKDEDIRDELSESSLEIVKGSRLLFYYVDSYVAQESREYYSEI
jgi:hypothetical protein